MIWGTGSGTGYFLVGIVVTFPLGEITVLVPLPFGTMISPFGAVGGTIGKAPREPP
jgi:hypothetical protein